MIHTYRKYHPDKSELVMLERNAASKSYILRDKKYAKSASQKKTVMQFWPKDSVSKLEN